MRIISKYSLTIIPVLALLLAGTFTSCKKYADPPPYFEDDLDTTNLPVSRRVLLIGIDGAVSSEVKAIAPATITGMLNQAKFQWDAVTDEISTDAASWKTLVSGISYSKHQIADSSFTYTPPQGEDTHGGMPPYYPSMFSYILSSANKSNMRTSFISSWPVLVERVVPEVLDPILTTTDQGVKDSAVKRITTGNPEFMVVNFNAPAIAGKTGGFTQANTAYKNAITQTDGYIGEIMAALKARPEYNKREEWLVIIANTHGGIGNSYGGASSNETTGFILYYNEKFDKMEFTKEGTFVGAEMTGAQGAAIRAVMSDPTAYDPGTGPMTFEMKVKGSLSGSYPGFLHKKELVSAASLIAGASGTGFACFSSGSGDVNIQFKAASGTSPNQRKQTGDLRVFDGASWHTISIVFRQDSAGKKWVKFYSDGIYQDGHDVTDWGSFASTAPLTIGWGQFDFPTAFVRYNVADVRAFNVALSGKEIAENLCLTDITKHPKYNNLTGFWPCNDGLGGRFKNYAPGAVDKDFILENSFKWLSVNPFPCTIPGITDPGRRSFLLTNSGIANIAFYWLGVPVNSSWGFEGDKWLTDYENEFIDFR